MNRLITNCYTCTRALVREAFLLLTTMAIGREPGRRSTHTLPSITLSSFSIASTIPAASVLRSSNWEFRVLNENLAKRPAGRVSGFRVFKRVAASARGKSIYGNEARTLRVRYLHARFKFELLGNCKDCKGRVRGGEARPQISAVGALSGAARLPGAIQSLCAALVAGAIHAVRHVAASDVRVAGLAAEALRREDWQRRDHSPFCQDSLSLEADYRGLLSHRRRGAPLYLWRDRDRGLRGDISAVLYLHRLP